MSEPRSSIDTNVQIIQVWAVNGPAKGELEREGRKNVRDLKKEETKKSIRVRRKLFISGTLKSKELGELCVKG